MGRDYIFPQASYVQENSSSFLWITFEAIKRGPISAWGRAQRAGVETESVGSWKFLAPVEIEENIVHDWSENEGAFGTDVMAMYNDVKQLLLSVKPAAGVGWDSIKKLFEFKSGNKFNQLDKEIQTRLSNPMAAQQVQAKVDYPLQYKNSKRLEYTMTFDVHVLNENRGEVFSAIRELEKCSCSQMNEGSATGIMFPCLFRVYSYPLPILNIQQAAITSIQPTWIGPFVEDGNPLKCELTITFMDMLPLYENTTFNTNSGNQINVEQPQTPSSSGVVDMKSAEFATEAQIQRAKPTTPAKVINNITDTNMPLL